MADKLLKEDYEEPICPFCTPDKVTTVPVGRIIEKLDEYLSRNNYSAAESHLRYWLDEAVGVNDKRGQLAIINELIGLNRKLGNEAEALSFSEKALALSEVLGLTETITHGTTLLNAATAYKAFGQADKALTLYEKAKSLYEKLLSNDDERLGGLYNNMALALLDLESFDEAEKMFNHAIAVMRLTKNGEPETAITYCNLANLVEAKLGLEIGDSKIKEYLETAMELLNTDGIAHDGNYAYVCEKCAPTFGYYGFFAYENELNKRSRRIYERS